MSLGPSGRPSQELVDAVTLGPKVHAVGRSAPGSALLSHAPLHARNKALVGLELLLVGGTELLAGLAARRLCSVQLALQTPHRLSGQARTPVRSISHGRACAHTHALAVCKPRPCAPPTGVCWPW